MVRGRGASGVGDRRNTCNQLTGTRPAFFSRYLNVHPLFGFPDICRKNAFFFKLDKSAKSV